MSEPTLILKVKVFDDSVTADDIAKLIDNAFNDADVAYWQTEYIKET